VPYISSYAPHQIRDDCGGFVMGDLHANVSRFLDVTMDYSQLFYGRNSKLWVIGKKLQGDVQSLQIYSGDSASPQFRPLSNELLPVRVGISQQTKSIAAIRMDPTQVRSYGPGSISLPNDSLQVYIKNPNAAWTTLGPTGNWSSVKFAHNTLLAQKQQNGLSRQDGGSLLKWDARANTWIEKLSWAGPVSLNKGGDIAVAYGQNGGRSGLYKSLDGGNQWLEVPAFAQTMAQLRAGASTWTEVVLDVSEDGSQILVAMYADRLQRFLFSTDAGASFRLLPEGFVYRIIAGGQKLARLSDLGLQVSIDQGQSFREVRGAQSVTSLTLSVGSYLLGYGPSWQGWSEDIAETWQELPFRLKRLYSGPHQLLTGPDGQPVFVSNTLYSGSTPVSSRTGPGGGMAANRESSITLQYLGNGAFAVLEKNGTFEIF
jgi:hypothetical protein